MAEVLVSFTTPTRSTTGDLYWSRALGKRGNDGLWQGWIEFTRAGDDEVVCTSRESTQPKRDDLMYWAQGLTATYLEGALERALRPTPELAPRGETRQFVDSSPRHSTNAGSISRRVVLDPFLTYTEGEDLLRKQLGALSHDHLQTIIEAYQFVDAGDPDWARTAPDAALVERIVERVRSRFIAGSGTAPVAEAARRNATAQDRPA